VAVLCEETEDGDYYGWEYSRGPRATEFSEFLGEGEIERRLAQIRALPRVADAQIEEDEDGFGLLVIWTPETQTALDGGEGCLEVTEECEGVGVKACAILYGIPQNLIQIRPAELPN